MKKTILLISIVTILMSCGENSNNSIRERIAQNIQQMKQDAAQQRAAVSIQNVITGMEPFTIYDLTWYPCVAITFKNNSNEDITQGIEISAIFIDNIKGEQLGSARGFLSGSDDVFVAGATKQITLKGGTSWFKNDNRNITARIYINDYINGTQLIDTVNIKNVLFMGD